MLSTPTPRLPVTMRTRYPRLNATPICPRDQVNRTVSKQYWRANHASLPPNGGPPKMHLHLEFCTFSIFKRPLRWAQ